jgi:hypothetical protein
MNKKNKTNVRLKEVELSQQEWWDAQRSSVHRNQKRYTRKGRRQKNWLPDDSDEY